MTVDGDGSSTLLLLDWLILHEILYRSMSASCWVKTNAQLMADLTRSFDLLLGSDMAYASAMQAAYAISPRLALTLFLRIEPLQKRHGKVEQTALISPILSTLLSRPKMVSESAQATAWQFAPLLVELAVFENRSAPTSGLGQHEVLVKELAFLPSVPVYVALSLLSRCDADKKENRPQSIEAHKVPAIFK